VSTILPQGAETHYNKNIHNRGLMTQTLQEQATEVITANVYKHTQMLCEALKMDYINSCVRHHERSLVTDPTSKFHKDQLVELKSGVSDYDFVIESGRKYHKIVMVNNQRSVHAFIDKNTGEVYKAASWRGPAKDVRFDLRLIKDREYLLENADWAGGYLYKR
tara:strand:- start:1741 stop:2229 length:489 start_codon:yes stop_codon:yes gene_type:complete